MKNIIYTFLVVSLFIFSCGTQQNTVASADETQKEEPVRIANDSLEYEVIIIDIGFNTYLNTIARPMSFYSNEFLRTRNNYYVIEWNSRARNPSRFSPNIYENIIDHKTHIDYGLEVNYKLFWYFQFAQRKYNMRLGSFRLIGP